LPTFNLFPEIAEGAFPKQYIYTVAHESGSATPNFLPLRGLRGKNALLLLKTFACASGL
jgi:hypothetical protein